MGGRGQACALLFTVAKIVPTIRPQLRRLPPASPPRRKSKKVVRVALAHKLLTRLNAKARKTRQLAAIAT